MYLAQTPVKELRPLFLSPSGGIRPVIAIKACDPAAWAVEFGYDTGTENRVRPRVVSRDLRQHRAAGDCPERRRPPQTPCSGT